MSDLEIVKEFLVESYENLDRLDRELVALEKDPTNRDTLASVFRTIHTIKGTSGFLAFNKLGAVAHVGESLLARLRDGHLALNPEITTALLAMVDAVRQILGSIEAQGNEGDRNYDRLIATFHHDVAAAGMAQPLVALVHLSDLLCRLRDLGYGYYEAVGVGLAGEVAWSMLVKDCPRLATMDLARLTMDLDGVMEEIVAVVDAVFRPSS